MARLLLVSDALVMRTALRSFLDSEPGLTVAAEADTCCEAVSAARHEHPDIVLIDLNSAEDLLECVEAIVNASETSRVIALCDRTMFLDRSRLVEIGAAGLVLKQDRAEVLLHAIRKVHAGELWLDRANTAAVLSRMVRRRRERDAELERISALTKREHEIVSLVGEGLKNAAIAERLSISEATVRNHLTSIFDKLDVADRFELAVYAFKRGLVRYPQSGQDAASGRR
jgi:DNA-binding NarL/FixJ family response regulator